jgi:glutamate/tyrosine decarboxylase-like PLP-dependent enzyme
MEMAGIGSDQLRLIPVDDRQRMGPAALRDAIERDMAQGIQPFLVVGTAGTVDTGAVDPLDQLAAVCAEHGIWFHVDGAFGALGMLAPTLAPLFRGIEQADSVAFDFHKWGQVPYDAGCIVVRDPAKQMAAFAQHAAYLRRETRGLAGGHPWPCDLGPDLSRGFRALKVWMTLKTYGADALGDVVARTCAIARHLAARVVAEPELELMAPVGLNIVCFRPLGLSDRAVADLVADLHEDGVAAPSTTTIGGRLAIRAAIVNHRTREADVDALVDAVLAAARVHRAV